MGLEGGGEIVELIDVMPTVLNYFDIPAPKNIRGRSLWPLIHGEIRPDHIAMIEHAGRNLVRQLIQIPKAPQYHRQPNARCTSNGQMIRGKTRGRLSGTSCPSWDVESGPETWL